MTEYIDPLDYIPERNIDEKLKLVLEDPFEVNFRSNASEEIEFEPEDPLIRNTRVDTSNRNVEVQYNSQSVEEKYIVVMKGVGLGIVESHANIPSGEHSSTTTVNYHIVTPELDLMYDGQGYFETRNELPRNAAKKAPEFLEKANEILELDFSTAAELEGPSGGKKSSVPPPDKDPLFDE